ncbi:leucine-rich repeat-containing protein 15-like [Sycon ciliatum]|uniref:leucine-rich repeat-containing protein 15-like n=1 Tax=Sycon ciliatum TaxID=27933 RepID=UPI0031F65051
MVLQFKMSIHTVLSLVICCYVLTGTTVMSCPASCSCDGAPTHTVDCASRGLTMVPGGIPNTTLYLYLSSNRLASLPPDVFANLTLLQYLYLGGNHIQNLSDGVFSGLTNLEQLRLHDNQIQNLSDGVFSDLPNLGTLHLHDNQIQNLSDGVFSGLPNLRTLHLHDNQIQNLSDGVFSVLPNLRTLRLDLNQIQTLSDGVFSGLPNLQILDLFNTQIQTLSDGVFSGLTNLRRLLLNNNQIQTLSDGVFTGLPNLQTLLLYSNRLASLPPDVFANLTLLQYLDLYNNQIQTLSDGVFSGLTNLKTLLFYRNPIQTLSDGVFSGLPNLRLLYLYKNQIQNLSDGVFSGLPNLQSLWLNNNQIQTLSDGVFSGLPNLQALYLDNNQIQNFNDGVFSGLTNLRLLYLYNNQIQNLSDGVFTGLPNLQTLWLNDNSLILTPRLYVILYGIGKISSSPCYDSCVRVDSMVEVYLSKVPCRAQLPTHFLETSHPVTDKAGAAHCGQTAADVILVVDESRSMEPHYKDRLCQIVGNLSVSLEEHGIGLYPGKPNQYTVVGFGHLKGETGSDGLAGPHVIRSNTGRQVYDLAGFREACAKLRNTGSVEDGYLAIKYALENITSEGSTLLRLKRNDVAPIIILVSDEDRDIQLQGKGITRNSIKKLIRKSGATLEAIVDNSIWYNNQRGFGMDSKGTLYIAENTTHYTTSNKQQHRRYLALHYRNTRKDYSSVALELKGAVWDLNSILDSDALFASHVNAFVESTVTHVENRVHKCCSCQCAHGPEHSSLHCTYASSVQECKRP